METVLPEVIASKIEVDPDTGCWVWSAARDRLGYGRIRWQGKTRFSHRVVYALLRDANIDGQDIDHLCRLPACCNPDHLEAVDHAENLRRGIGGALARARYAEHLYCPAGHPLFGDNLYLTRTKQGHKNKQCRICRAASDRRRKARLRAERAAAKQ